MNLNHRLADGKGGGGFSSLHKIGYPLTFIIPLLIFGLSILTLVAYFGSSWETGSLSLVFLPLVGKLLIPILSGEDNLLLSTIFLVGLAIGPVSFYAYVYFLTKRHLPSLLTGLLTLLPIVPFSSSVPERLVLALVEYDGAHILGLSLLPWIAILYHNYMRWGKNKWQIATVVMAVLLGLISFFSFLVLIVILFFISVSEALVSLGRVKLKRFVVTATLLMVVFVAIYNFALLDMMRSEAGKVTLAVVWNLLPMTFFIVPILGTFAFLIFDRRPALQPLFLSLGFTVTFGMLHMVRISFVETTIFNQSRYAAEVSFVAAFLVGILMMWVFDLVRGGKLVARFPRLKGYHIHLAYAFIVSVIGSLIASLFLIPRSL